MCLETIAKRNISQWNWDGDYIVHKCIVPSSRPVVGFARTHQYDIDVREFLVSSRNEVMRRTIDKDIMEFVKEKAADGWELFQSRDRGSFDYRASVIKEFVSEHIRYEHTGTRDPWQFPDETVAVQSGDCEDRALLIASLMIAVGISSYNVRVALGKMKFWDKQGRTFTADHVWVMYKTEVGRWLVIEPSVAKTRILKSDAIPRSTIRNPISAEYVPYYVFNDQHLWQVFNSDNLEPRKELEIRKTWSKIDPSFTGRVHKSILEQALSPSVCPPDVGAKLIRFKYFGLVDPIDEGTYDPVDHFDNGLITEGWGKVKANLEVFCREGINENGTKAFAFAAHAIADFYAHSSFVHFSKNSQPCNPNVPTFGLMVRPLYTSEMGFDLTHPRFTVNSALWTKSKSAAAAEFEGQVISGRYAQVGDSVRGEYERRAGILEHLPPRCGGLPHHEEIAVDGGRLWDDDWKPSGHKLYEDDESYWTQFYLRKGAAINHVRAAFTQNFSRQ